MRKKMKLRMKTMATLIAAVLIAMMGVMPALAVDPSVPLTVEILPIVSIRVISPDVDYGSLLPGEYRYVNVTLENYGTVDVTVSGEVFGQFFIDNLYLYVVPSLVVGQNSSLTETRLTCPESVDAGTYDGSILFTATGPT